MTRGALPRERVSFAWCLHRQKIHKESRSAWITCGELPEERESRVDVHAFSVRRDENRAAIAWLAWIVAGDQRLIVLVKRTRHVETSLLNPSVEICLSN